MIFYLLTKFIKEPIFSDKRDFASDIYRPSSYKETTYSLGIDKDCNDRHEGRAIFSSPKEIFILNHFYSTSCASNTNQKLLSDAVSTSLSKIDCGIVNSRDEIKTRVELCLKQNLFPNFIAVDFVEQGNYGGAREVVFELNKVGKTNALSTQALLPKTYSSYLPSNYTPTKYTREILSNTLLSFNTFLGLGLGVFSAFCFYKCYHIPRYYVPRHEKIE